MLASLLDFLGLTRGADSAMDRGAVHPRPAATRHPWGGEQPRGGRGSVTFR